jgi:hypothetical protein
MKNEMRFIPASVLLIVQGDFASVVAALESRVWQDKRWLAVAMWVESTGNWYVFPREDFGRRVTEFLDLAPVNRTVNSFEIVFYIHEWRGAESIKSAPDIAKRIHGSLVLKSDTAPRSDPTNLAGAWIPMPPAKTVAGLPIQTEASRRHSPPPSTGFLLKSRSTFEGLESVSVETVVSAPKTVAAPTLERRMPHVDFLPEAPLLGQQFKVEVYADLSAFQSGETGDLNVSMPAQQESVQIEVWLSTSNGLRVVNAAVQFITLSRDQPKTTSAIFEVDWTPPQPDDDPAAEERVMATFSQASRPCGWVTRAVVPGQETPAPTETIESSASTALLPDMIVTIVSPQHDEVHFQVGVECPALPDFKIKQVAPWTLSARSEDLMRYYITLFSAAGMANEDRLIRLDGVGQELYVLAPDHFKKALVQLAASVNRPLKILVVSEEPHIPWELMIPADDNPLPLGARHVIGRWTSPDGRPTQQHLRLDGAWVIAPNYQGFADALPFQKQEADFVASLTGGVRIAPATIQSLQNGAVTDLKPLFHFVGHGAVTDAAMAQALLLDEAKPMIQIDLRGMRKLADGLRKTKSLVFLNACQAGSPIRSLGGGVGGLAATFLSMGASAVIAPLWSVRDEIAHLVAEMVYTGLQNGTAPIPEILRQCRAKTYLGPNSGEDTFAAYCFYGDPCLTVDCVGWVAPALL